MEHRGMSKQEIAQAREQFGPVPILSSEQPELFEGFFSQLVNSIRPLDFLELMLIWRYALADWSASRAIHHGTLAIERRYQEGARQELQRARLQQAQKRRETREHISNHTPADIAALAALEEEVMESDDMEQMFKRKATEQDHNIAFERSMVFQEQLDKLITSASRRRDDALQQLELYRIGLGAQAREMAGRLLEGEVRDDSSPLLIEGPSLCPAGEGAITAEGAADKAIEQARQ